jgi:hypothetical protein
LDPVHAPYKETPCMLSIREDPATLLAAAVLGAANI